MKAGNKRAEKQKIYNLYNQLYDEAYKESAKDIMKQTVAIMLYALRTSEDNYTDEDLRSFYEQFLRTLNSPKIFGKQLRSDQVVDYIKTELKIDLDRIDPEVYESEPIVVPTGYTNIQSTGRFVNYAQNESTAKD